MDRKTKVPLKQSLQQQLEQPQLSNQQLEQLMQLQQGSRPHKLPEKLMRYKSRQTFAAACFLIMIWGVSTTLLGPTNPVPNTSVGLNVNKANIDNLNMTVINAISTEVVKNHLKLKPLDIKTNSIEDVRNFFGLLDFSPIAPTDNKEKLGLFSDSLLGGRYCSIQGTTAAQLRFNKNNQLRTLYQVPYDSTQYGNIPATDLGQSPFEIEVKGLKVQLWQERGLMMVLVSP